MYCVIQKVINKKLNPYGASKELKVESCRSTSADGISRTRYSYRFSEECFDRPNLEAYKIMIHHSYREAGKVKKRQWVICTMGYYTMLDSWAGECTTSKKLKPKLDEMGISETQLWEMVYEKLDPIVSGVKAEFELTEEFQIKQQHDEILWTYRSSKQSFERKYGSDTYDFCYDVFGELKKPKYLQELIDLRERSQQREREWQEQSNNYSNSSNYSSYSVSPLSNYSDSDKAMLKKVYRALSKSFHPDITKDDGEIMKLINRLKDGWGI